MTQRIEIDLPGGVGESVDRARRRVGMYMHAPPETRIECAYCTWHSSTTSRVELHEKIRQHVEDYCPEHPMRDLEESTKQLRGEVAQLRERLAKFESPDGADDTKATERLNARLEAEVTRQERAELERLQKKYERGD